MSEFHAHEEAMDSRGYRAVSGTSVTALVLGLLSFLAPVFEVFWIFPVAAVLVACMALHRIGQPESNLTGRRIAYAGLFLALLFGSLAPARHYRRQVIINRQAEEFATRWFALLQEGSMLKAHQLLMDPKRRVTQNMVLNEQYKNDVKLKELFVKFTEEELVKRLVAGKGQTTYELIDNLGQAKNQQVITISQLYRATIQDGGIASTVEIKLGISRQLDKRNKQTYWTVSEFQEAG